MLGKFKGYYSSGKPRIIPISAWTGSYVGLDPRDVIIPCGRCAGCRLDISREWADRMMLELDHTNKAVFLTLTYKPDSVPVAMFSDEGMPVYTLRKKDAQDFLKRLRKRYSAKGVTLRFYLAGEYGDNTARPHYHAIIFGIDLSDIESDFGLQCVGKSSMNEPYYGSEEFASKVWKNGNVLFTSVSWQTCAYVARYVMKKQIGSNDVFNYAETNREPVFSLKSLKPGLGGFYAIDHPDFYKTDEIFIKDVNGRTQRHSVPVPDYLYKNLRLTNPDLYDTIKSRRKLSMKLKADATLAATDLDFVEYNKVVENKSFSSIGSLSRNSF